METAGADDATTPAPRLHVRIHAALGEIPAAAWNALLPDANPFLDHAFLDGLERHGCIDPQAGWQPHHLGLYEDGQLVAAAPAYLKGNSHGEFVFDWDWAEAYARHGLDYYPKLLCAIPYSPVTGPRLLAAGGPQAPQRRAALAAALRAEAMRLGLSSAHANFAPAGDAPVFTQAGWLARSDWQYHWRNPGHWRDFDDFLAALSHRKRKNIRQERARVAAAGVHCTIHHGDEIDREGWHALHRFYRGTFDGKGNYPALTAAFFRHLGHAMPRRVVAVLCRRGGRVVAGALMLRSEDTLYGRYWGADEHVDGLHFEACYYQGIAYCLREGLAVFEPGAQGTHKIARGFLPSRTQSFHWIADPRFRRAIADALAREAAFMDARGEELLAHSPYARTGTDSTGSGT